MLKPRPFLLFLTLLILPLLIHADEPLEEWEVPPMVRWYTPPTQSISFFFVAAEGYKVTTLENQSTVFAGTGEWANPTSGAFFWFFRSLKTSSKDLIIWFNGGPGW
ncbi:hypothetical protein BC829DRAFT_398242 [Chytridium lagenaria]|nr:hypothetical protein BC829DRAFT_398242 [Chytridium lagenaria]